ncbi:hypothetical protein EFN25_09585 [Propionibacterium freudenreichii]|nr:hypothetical protein [Propionibacterium freudenreichii]
MSGVDALRVVTTMAPAMSTTSTTPIAISTVRRVTFGRGSCDGRGCRTRGCLLFGDQFTAGVAGWRWVGGAS